MAFFVFSSFYQKNPKIFMLYRKGNDVHWLEFELLSECSHLKHGIFLRHGGHSQGAFGSLNLAFNKGDDDENVIANRKKASEALGLTNLISTSQRHGTDIISASSLPASNLKAGDVLTTNSKGASLLILHADCQAAIIFDPIRLALANVHCGWRGSVQNIYAKTIDYMKKVYGSLPEDLLVGISPSLGPYSAQFIHYREELPESFWQFQVKPLYFDFWEITRFQLLQEGVLSHHIEIAGIDTYENTKDFFSYRRSHLTGNNGTFAVVI